MNYTLPNTEGRYKKIIVALKEDIAVKLAASTIALVFSQIMGLITTLSNMFRTPMELIVLLIIAIIVDWITGIIAAKRRGERIYAFGLRQTWIKIIEYSAGLMILSGIANVFGKADIQGWVGYVFVPIKNIHWLGYFYAIFTELKSIDDNIGGNDDSGPITKVIKIIQRQISKNVDPKD